jgi:uncharacterized protein (TIGR02246 family)
MTDEERIRLTLTRYVRYADERDADGWSGLFSEDARFTPRGGRLYEGREAIRAWFVQLFRDRPDNRSVHLCGNHEILVDGDTALAASDVVVFESDADQPWGVHQVNRYFDRLVRRDTTWLLAERRIEGR